MLKAMIGLLLLCAAVPTLAQSRIFRCQDAHGQWVFQGRPCADGLTDARDAARPEAAAAQTTRGMLPVPAQCEQVLPKFMLADPALDGAELTIVASRDGNGYQVLMRLAGVLEREDGPVPAQFSERLGAQGLRFDSGELISPDFRRGDRELGYGYARSAALLERAGKSTLLDVEIEPRGYAQSLLTAPIGSALLAAVRAELLRCHQVRERALKLLGGERKQQPGQAGADAETQRQ